MVQVLGIFLVRDGDLLHGEGFFLVVVSLLVVVEIAVLVLLIALVAVEAVVILTFGELGLGTLLFSLGGSGILLLSRLYRLCLFGLLCFLGFLLVLFGLLLLGRSASALLGRVFPCLCYGCFCGRSGCGFGRSALLLNSFLRFGFLRYSFLDRLDLHGLLGDRFSLDDEFLCSLRGLFGHNCVFVIH